MNVKCNLFFQILGWGRGHWALLRYHQVAANTRYYRIYYLKTNKHDGATISCILTEKMDMWSFFKILFPLSPQHLCFSFGKTMFLIKFSCNMEIFSAFK